MDLIQQSHMDDILSKSKNKTAAKLKRVALMHKQMMEKEEFKARMDRHMNQNLEEMRRMHEVKQLKAVEEQVRLNTLSCLELPFTKCCLYILDPSF